jgi:serine/threonine protein kinase
MTDLELDELDARVPVVPRGHEVLPGYTVVGFLSRGLRLDTYDVYSAERECRCVVKIVRPDRRDVRRVREAVLTEGRLLHKLAHPHLVRCYEVVEHPTPAAVLETLTGRTLDAVLDQSLLPEQDSVELGLQLSSALSYLHADGWLHLDVKPENVVVQGSRAILIDLSLADRPGDGREGAGTPEYMAPEQHSGLGLSGATDVWGLAQVLVESLTGDVAAPGWPAHRLPREAWWRRRPSLRPAYVELLQSCLDPEPKRRPSMRQVRAALEALR